MKASVGVEVQLHVYLTSALDGGEWSPSRSNRIYLKGNNPFPVGVGQEAGWIQKPVTILW
jgi:hypothetical protein